MLSGFALVTIGGYLKVALGQYTHLVDGYSNTPVAFFLIATGIVVVFFHVVGGLFVHTVSIPSKRKQLSRQFLVLVIIFAVLTVMILVAAIMCFTHVSHLHNSFKHGLTTAMSMYAGECNFIIKANCVVSFTIFLQLNAQLV